MAASKFGLCRVPTSEDYYNVSGPGQKLGPIRILGPMRMRPPFHQLLIEAFRSRQHMGAAPWPRLVAEPNLHQPRKGSGRAHKPALAVLLCSCGRGITWTVADFQPPHRTKPSPTSSSSTMASWKRTRGFILGFECHLRPPQRLLSAQLPDIALALASEVSACSSSAP